MACIAPTAQEWRDSMPDWTDEYTADELERAWMRVDMKHIRRGYERNYHDWCNFRAATLREARKRGLDTSVTGLGT